MPHPINRLVGKHVEGLARRESAGKTPPRLSGRESMRLSYLRRADLFRCLSVEQLRQLSDESEMRELARREVWLIGNQDDHVHVVVNGGVKLCRTSPLGRRIVEGILERGDVFGSLTDRNDRTYYVEALDRVVLISMPRQALRKALEVEPELSLEIVQIIEDRERRLSMRLESLVFKDVPARVVETLLLLTREHGNPCVHGFAVDVRVSQQDIADLVGASRQMVNRVIRDLTLKFYVKRKGRVLCILDISRLERLVDEL